MNLHVNASYLRAEIHRLIEAYPDLADDETLRADMLEAETDLEKVVSKALTERREAETMALAIKEREADLSCRRARFEKKAEAMRALIKSILQWADLDKLMLPEATLSIMRPRTSVNVLDVNELPQGYFKSVRQADKTAIKSALEQGQEIPGAELALGGPGLSIRTK